MANNGGQDQLQLYIGPANGYATPAVAGTWTATSAMGSTAQTNIWNTPGNYLTVTGVQLEKGSVATPFEFRNYAQELALCQRYYYIVSSAVNPGGYAVLCQGSFIGGTTVAQCLVNFPVTMRAITSPANFSNSAVSTFWFGAGSGATCTAVALVSGAQNVNGAQLSFTTSSAVTAGTGCIIEAANTGSAFLGFSAEL